MEPTTRIELKRSIKPIARKEIPAGTPGYVLGEITGLGLYDAILMVDGEEVHTSLFRTEFKIVT